MIKKVGLLIVLLIAGNSHSAAPATHVFFAELYFKICKPHYTEKEKAAFIRGTLFPDIRYLANIPREKTHAEDVSLKKIVGMKSPYRAGKLFHSFVDNQRAQVVKREKIDKLLHVEGMGKKTIAALLPKNLQATFIKVVEDELCFKKIDNEMVRRALVNFDPEEKNEGIPYATLREWHGYLRNYFKQSPVTLLKESPNKLLAQSAQKKAKQFTMSPMMVTMAAPSVEQFAKNKKMKGYFSILTNEFQKKLKTEMVGRP